MRSPCSRKTGRPFQPYYDPGIHQIDGNFSGKHLLNTAKTAKTSVSEPSDEQLIKRFQEGDLYAFEMIVHKYKNQLTNFVYNFLGNRIDAEDVVQETFLRVYKNKHRYKQIAKFSTWIYTIASNLAKTELRRRKRRKLFSISQLGFEDKDYDIPDSAFSPEKVIEEDFKGREIRAEINKLPEKFREVVVLRDVQEFSYEEISRILHIPIGTVKSRANRGRLRLQKQLAHLLAK